MYRLVWEKGIIKSAVVVLVLLWTTKVRTAGREAPKRVRAWCEMLLLGKCYEERWNEGNLEESVDGGDARTLNGGETRSAVREERGDVGGVISKRRFVIHASWDHGLIIGMSLHCPLFFPL